MALIETERLLLRPLEESDVDALAAIYADPEVSRFLGGVPRDRGEVWRHLALILGHERLRGYTLHAVVERASGEFVGRVGLWRPEGWPGIEVGWALARSAWGHGYASEAAAAWRDWAFASLPTPDPPFLYSLIAPDNTRSAAVARRIGHELLGTWMHRGQPCQLWGQPWPAGSLDSPWVTAASVLSAAPARP